MRRCFLLLGLLVLTGCPQPQPQPQPNPPNVIEEQKAIESTVIVVESMASATFPTNCEATGEAWSALDTSSLAAAQNASVPRTEGQKARYLAAMAQASKAIPVCLGVETCSSNCLDCEWVQCVEHLLACPQDAQRCCLADACGSAAQ